MQKISMYLRMVIRALLKRKTRVAIALTALIIGTGVISGVISVYYDINNKMSKELRSYGANFFLKPSQGDTLTEAKIRDIADDFDGEQLMGYSPYLYGIGQKDKRKLVVVGTWLDQIEKVTPYWEIAGESNFKRDDLDSILIGSNIAEKLNLAVGKTINLKSEETGKNRNFVIKGILKTGSTEDNQVFVNLPAAQQLFNLKDKANIVYFSLIGKSDSLNLAVKNIDKSDSEVEFKPIKQISKSEGKILEKIKSLIYLVILVILLSTLLCVTTTTMAMVIERRREIGLRKALGAQNRSIIVEFLGEGITLGLIGGLLGSLLGFGLAQVIGQSVFESYINPRVSVAFMVTFMSILVASIASIIPVRMATNVEPALILKGE